jgi:hypothetical protein
MAVPLEDIGFAPDTELPDPDLVVVREKAYGSGGIDLTAYGIGTGPVSYVQSIYFRFFVDNEVSTVDSYTGLVAFPQQIEILGIITDITDLGGENDDGVATDTDLIFGIATDPDDYSESDRGFECCGGIASSEFVCITSANAFVFGLNINGGVDDFRVIIDYGESFPESLAFDISAYDAGSLGGALPSLGIRVGDDSNPAVLGSGDFGEAGTVIGIPLTASEAPDTAGSMPFSPLDNLYILRDTSGDTFADAYDVTLNLPAPDLFRINADTLSNPVGISDGPDSMIYALGVSTGLSIIDPETRSVTMAVLPDLTGDYVDLTGLSGERALFILRDTSGDTYVDRLSVDSLEVTETFTISQSVIDSPVGITDASDGNLYVLGSGGGFVSVDTDSGIVATLSLPASTGSYVSITGRESANRLYLFRDTSGFSYVDEYDIDSQSTVLGLVQALLIGSPASITDGPGDLIYLIGQGSSSAASYEVIDPDLGAVLEANSCLDFVGTNVSMTNIGTSESSCAGVGDVRVHGDRIVHWAAPNPFESSVRIQYQISRAARVRVSVIDIRGRLVSVLCESKRSGGVHTEVWNGSLKNGSKAPPGIYFYRIDLGPTSAMGKLVFVR